MGETKCKELGVESIWDCYFCADRNVGTLSKLKENPLGTFLEGWRPSGLLENILTDRDMQEDSHKPRTEASLFSATADEGNPIEKYI